VQWLQKAGNEEAAGWTLPGEFPPSMKLRCVVDQEGHWPEIRFNLVKRDPGSKDDTTTF
jgi:hypothetical protein